MEINHKNYIDLIAKGGISIILLYIIIHFGNLYYQKIEEVNKELLSIRVELAKIQSSIIDKEDINRIIQEKINLHEAKYHLHQQK